MVGTRDQQVFALYGEQKNAGAVDAPLFPTNGIISLIASIGSDGNPGQGVTGTPGGSVSTTLSAAAAVGATTVTVTSATGIVAGSTIIQIDANSGTSTTSECRLVTAISTDTLTLDAGLAYAHASGVAVISVVAPFSHQIAQQSVLPSLTIEKNIGGFQSLQFPGSRIGKYSLKGEAGNSEATFSADVVAQSYAILDTPSPISFLSEEPFVFSEFDLTWENGQLKQSTNFALDIDNGLKSTYAFNGTHELQFLTATALKVNGTFDVVFDSLNDPTYGYFSQMQAGTEAALNFTLTHPVNDESVSLRMGYVRLATDKIDAKMGDVIVENIAYEARRSLSGNPSTTISAVISNSAHLAY